MNRFSIKYNKLSFNVRKISDWYQDKRVKKHYMLLLIVFMLIFFLPTKHFDEGNKRKDHYQTKSENSRKRARPACQSIKSVYKSTFVLPEVRKLYLHHQILPTVENCRGCERRLLRSL